MADSGDIAAWAALAAALLALVVALAQAAQQYAATAQSMRKCEKSVWGPMPGHAGRRVWVWHQLRFRIVFDMPVFIPTEYWRSPGNARQFPPHRVTTLPAPFDPPSSANKNPEGGSVQSRSEACWVSFARQLSQACPAAVRVGLMVGDADRLPADLPVVLMQVSLRDVVALGLTAGMSLQSARVDFIEMSGPAGFVKSSDHPLLGRLLHFTAFSSDLRPTLLSGDISRSWLWRLEGIASVANQPFEESKRRYYEGMGMRWRTHTTQIPSFRPRYHLKNSSEEEEEEEEETLLRFINLEGKEHDIQADKCETWDALLQTLESEGIAKAPYIIRIGVENKRVAPNSWKTLHRVIRKGDLQTSFHIAQGEYVSTRPEPEVTVSAEAKSPEEDEASAQKDETSAQPLEDIAEEEEDEDSAQSLQEITEEEENVPDMDPADIASEKTKETAASHPPEEETTPPQASAPASPPSRKEKQPRKPRLALPWVKEDPDPERPARPAPKPTTIRIDFSSSDSEEYWRQKRAGAYVSRTTAFYTPEPPVLSFYWASQVDIELGCWATPWGDGLYTDCLESLDMMVDLGLAGLSYSIRESTAGARRKRDPDDPLKRAITYVEFPDRGVFSLEDLWQRLRKGGHTWPPYAFNARGGITDLEPSALVGEGGGFPVEFGKDEPPLPLLALLKSVHDARTSSSSSVPTAAAQRQALARDRILELASLDLWLSRAARTRGVAESDRANLVSNAPAIVEELWLNFGDDIMQTREERWSRDGGDYALRRLAENMTFSLKASAPSAAEQCFVWVAFLRAVKVMECVRDGPSTFSALDMFKNDVLVYLV